MAEEMADNIALAKDDVRLGDSKTVGLEKGSFESEGCMGSFSKSATGCFSESFAESFSGSFTESLDSFKEMILSQLSEKRYVHTMGVRETAAELCRIYGGQLDKVGVSEKTGGEKKAGALEDMDLAGKADLAVCLHDLYRGRSVSELDELIEKYGIPDRYKGNANLAHGKIAAAAMKEEYCIADEDMINAVSYHTTGRAGMSLLEKIVFLSDAIEPGRDYPLVDKLREMSKIDLDKACLMSLEGTIKFLQAQGQTDIDQDTITARDWLKSIIND